MEVTGPIVVEVKLKPSFIKKALKIARDFDKSCINASKSFGSLKAAMEKSKRDTTPHLIGENPFLKQK